MVSCTDSDGFVKALPCCGVATGDDSEMQLLLDCGLLRQLLRMLNTETDPRVRRRACRVVANICAGRHSQLQAVPARAEDEHQCCLMFLGISFLAWTVLRHSCLKAKLIKNDARVAGCHVSHT